MAPSTPLFRVPADAANAANAAAEGSTILFQPQTRLRLIAQGCRRSGYPGITKVLFNRNAVASICRNPIRGWKNNPSIVPNVAETATLGWTTQPPCGYENSATVGVNLVNCSELWKHLTRDQVAADARNKGVGPNARTVGLPPFTATSGSAEAHH